MPLQQILKCGKIANVNLGSSAGYNTAVTDSSGNNVPDLAGNPVYVLIQVTGSSPPTSGVYLPPVEGNYAIVNNQCGTSISVKSNPNDASPVTIANTEIAFVMHNGTNYVKTSSTTASLDIGGYASDPSLASGDVMLIKSAADNTHYKTTLGALQSFLGILATVPSKLIVPVAYVYTNNISFSGLVANQNRETAPDGSRVLLTGQSSPISNGVRVVNSGGAWPRASDYTGSVADTIIQVSKTPGGYGLSTWRCVSAPGSDAAGSNPLFFVPCELDFTTSSTTDVWADPVYNRNPLVQRISGNDAAGGNCSVFAKQFQYKNSQPFTSKRVTANSSSTEIDIEQSSDIVPMLWEHYYASNGRAVKRGRKAWVEEFTASNAGGSIAIPLGQTDAFWQVHSGQIKITWHSTDEGHDYSITMPFSAVHAKRLTISSGAGSAGTNPSSPDRQAVNGTPSANSGQTLDSNGTTYDWPISGGASSEPKLTFTPTMILTAGSSQGVYGITLAYSSATPPSHTVDVMVAIDVVCMDSAVTQN